MKILEVLNAPPVSYQILGIDTAADFEQGSSKKGTIQISFAQLNKLFGQPKEIHNGDINYEWTIEFKYRDLNSDYNQQDQYDYDTVTVDIYDWRYQPNVDPALIDNWNVGSKSQTGLYVLQQYIQDNS